MNKSEYGIFLKIIELSTRIQDVAYLSHNEEGNILYSLLWHARYGHINYDSLRMMKKKCVFGSPAIICLGEDNMGVPREIPNVNK